VGNGRGKTLWVSHIPFSLHVEETEAQKEKEFPSRRHRVKVSDGGETGTQVSPNSVQSFHPMNFYVAGQPGTVSVGYYFIPFKKRGLPLLLRLLLFFLLSWLF
jgi:hypothetical protein